MVGAFVLILTFAPYAVGWLRSTPERVFSGAVYMEADAYSYLVKMRLGVRGHWLYHNMYAAEPHGEALLFFPFIVAGRIVRALGGSRAPVGMLIAAFHVWRALANVLLMWTLYRFYAALLPEVRQRRWAYALSLVGGGFGGLLAFSGLGVLWGSRPIDLYLGEAYGFVALFALPHVSTARACMLWAMLRLARFMDSGEGTAGDPQNALIISLLWLVMTLCVPFYILVAATVAAVWVMLHAIRHRAIPRRAVIWGGLAGLPGGLVILANLIMMRGDPVYAAWNAQNLLPRPHVLHFVLAFGLPLALAGIGARAAWRTGHRLTELAAAWLIAAPLLVLLPINVQVRLLEGAHIPLWGLAALGFDRLRTPLAERAIVRRALNAVFYPISLLSTAFLFLGAAATSLGDSEGVYVSGDAVGALEWLNAHGPFESVLLASEPVGRYAPARAGIRVVLGHGFETPDYVDRQALVAAFYSADMTDAERLALLMRYNVRYVYAGPDEQALTCQTGDCRGAPFDPARLDLRAIYRQGDVTLYEAAPR